MDQLNILTTPRTDLEAAFELMGNKDCSNVCYRMRYGAVYMTFDEFCSRFEENRKFEIKELEEKKRRWYDGNEWWDGEKLYIDRINATLEDYRNGTDGAWDLGKRFDFLDGTNHYFVHANGDVELLFAEDAADALALGFRVAGVQEAA